MERRVGGSVWCTLKSLKGGWDGMDGQVRKRSNSFLCPALSPFLEAKYRRPSGFFMHQPGEYKQSVPATFCTPFAFCGIHCDTSGLLTGTSLALEGRPNASDIERDFAAS